MRKTVLFYVCFLVCTSNAFAGGGGVTSTSNRDAWHENRKKLAAKILRQTKAFAKKANNTHFNKVIKEIAPRLTVGWFNYKFYAAAGRALPVNSYESFGPGNIGLVIAMKQDFKTKSHHPGIKSLKASNQYAHFNCGMKAIVVPEGATGLFRSFVLLHEMAHAYDYIRRGRCSTRAETIHDELYIWSSQDTLLRRGLGKKYESILTNIAKKLRIKMEAMATQTPDPGTAVGLVGAVAANEKKKSYKEVLTYSKQICTMFGKKPSCKLKRIEKGMVLNMAIFELIKSHPWLQNRRLKSGILVTTYIKMALLVS